MGELCLYPRPVLLGCIMCLTVTVIIQTLSVTCGLQRLKKDAEISLENAMELLVLLKLLMLVWLTAKVNYHAGQGFVYPSGHIAGRMLLFAALSVLSVVLAWRRHMFWPLTVLLASAITTPPAEKIAGEAFPVLYFAALIFWLLRCAHILYVRRNEQKHQLSVLSVKEAVDTLESGVLFGQSNGPVMLQNSRMQELMRVLTGKFQRNGEEFYRMLVQGDVLPSCKKGEMGDQLAYWLPDGSVWVFERFSLNVPGMADGHCALLVASNTTERWKATHQLWQQNQELERRNQELHQVLDNLGTICKTEETIHAKSRVHDVLGQRISLLLRAMREHREPDEVLLASFAEGLPRELTSVSADRSPETLDTLVEAFRGLGVRVHVVGTMPQELALARAFSEIATEAVTNSVRHGYASDVRIILTHQGGSWGMDVTDSGIPPSEPVTEGGGLQGMRRRTEKLGGTFVYSMSPRFRIKVIIPEGGAI